MRRFITLLVVLVAAMLPLSASLLHGYAQVAGPQGDEFNSTTFTAPFHVVCAQYASAPCPDPQSASTWSLDANNSGVLRIWTQFGSLLGTAAQASNNARNLVLQPYNPATDWTVTTKLTFPAVVTNASFLGQTAGLLVYQDDDNFIFLGRAFNPGHPSQLEFVQEVNGVDTISTVDENGSFPFTVYLRLTKVGTVYQASYSTDNVNFTSIAPGTPPATATPTATATATGTVTATATPSPTATSTPVPTGYSAMYATPQVGVFAFGGTNTAVGSNQIPADFGWFRVGLNSQTPLPSPTATNTAVPSATATATATSTPVATTVPTATSTPVPTATPVPATPTPVVIVKKAYHVGFRYVSIWYHFMRRGTYEHIVVQANRHTQFGIWVHVVFPSGLHYDYYANTDAGGHWEKSFLVPYNANSPYNNRAWVLFQLWHGKQTAKDYGYFGVL